MLMAVAGWTGTVAGFAWWLSSQFKETRHYLQGHFSQRYVDLEDKIERGDEKIAGEVKELAARVHNIELRNAGKNGAA